ncbi:NADH:ubiquinone oxidoreductase 11.6kD subunit [Colletotrichum acutatum]
MGPRIQLQSSNLTREYQTTQKPKYRAPANATPIRPSPITGKTSIETSLPPLDSLSKKRITLLPDPTMTAIRSTAAIRAARAIKTSAAAAPTTRAFSVTARRAGGGSDFDPPSGWLWGVKPGEKYEKEGWETPFYTLFCGGIIATGVVLAFKPDTSLDTWALEEARRRLEKEGILPDPEK